MDELDTVVALPLPAGYELLLRRLDDATAMRLWRAYWMHATAPDSVTVAAWWNALGAAVYFDGDDLLLAVAGHDPVFAAQLAATRAAAPPELQLSDGAMWLVRHLGDDAALWLRALVLVCDFPPGVVALLGGRPAVFPLVA